MQTLAHVGIDYGHEHLELEVPEERLVGVSRQPAPPPLPDPAGAIRDALEAPRGFPPLRRALTPDDHVAVVVDEHLPRLADLLTPALEHLVRAGIHPEAITLLCPPSGSSQAWLDDLPDEFQDVHVEVHDPTNRRQLAYLATTKQGRRLYLNRTVVDADQVVVLSGRGYDPLLGYSGGEGALYPALGDEATRQELWDRLSLVPPGDHAWPVQREAAEVTWLLGAPFLVQLIEGAGDEISHVVAGLADTSAEGQRLLNARWRGTVPGMVDTVVAGVSGDPARHGFGDLAAALATAARVVKPDGRIVLLTRFPAEPSDQSRWTSDCSPERPAGNGQGATLHAVSGTALLCQAENPQEALALLRQHKPLDMPAAFLWAHAVQRARVYLFSGLPAETAEELFTIPLEDTGQVQRLLDAGGSCLILPDAHKRLLVAEQ
jgi:nickel-dependent lactate racemase